MKKKKKDLGKTRAELITEVQQRLREREIGYLQPTLDALHGIKMVRADQGHFIFSRGNMVVVLPANTVSAMNLRDEAESISLRLIRLSRVRDLVLIRGEPYPTLRVCAAFNRKLGRFRRINKSERKLRELTRRRSLSQIF